MERDVPDRTNDEIVAWVSAEVLPLEASLRRWLRAATRDASEVDDIIHDLYARILDLNSVAHITDTRAYIFQAARNLLVDRSRNRQVINIGVAQNIDDFELSDSSPSPERAALAKAELRWIVGLIGRLPDRCRRVFELRRLYGLSQAETARNLAMSEGMVEKETARGMKLISRLIGDVGMNEAARSPQPAPETKPTHVRQRR
jgi:RNA polymerase sigma factor (sigma-70 family)